MIIPEEIILEIFLHIKIHTYLLKAQIDKNSFF